MTNLDEPIAKILTELCTAAYHPHRSILTQVIIQNMDQKRKDAVDAAGDAAALRAYCRRVCETFQEFHPLLTLLQEKKEPQAWQDLLNQLYQWALSILHKRASHVHHISLDEWAWEITNLAGLALASARFPYDCHFEAWAYKIVQHTALNEIRRHLTRQAQLENTAETFGNLTDIDYQLKDFYQRGSFLGGDHEQLKQGLAQLPEIQQRVVSMHYLEDFPLSEIAKKLGKSPNAVYQAHFQGLKKLRQLLSND